MLLKRTVAFKYIKHARQYYTINSKQLNTEKTQQELQKQLLKQLQTKIKMTGPITVADYMKEVLVNPASGYYMHSDVFGTTGDFVTSPELGQLFGEMVAIWFIHELQKIGIPKPLRIIELGPGRGTLCQDILRVFKNFNVLEQVSVNLVEASPYLSALQSKNICVNSNLMDSKKHLHYQEGITLHGIPIKWYSKLQDIPRGTFSLLVAHEFFDALPIHKFQKTEDGFREVLIDIDPDKENDFRFIIAREETPAVKLFIKNNEHREHIEFSPESAVTMEDIAGRTEEDGGISLIVDYGRNETTKDTFRGFKKHKLHDPLIESGSADLTADVDFTVLKTAAEKDNRTITFGPISQRDFLLKMGISQRFEKLKEKANADELKSLDFGYKMMTDSEQMGERFKFLSVFPFVLKNHLTKFPPAGFS